MGLSKIVVIVASFEAKPAEIAALNPWLKRVCAAQSNSPCCWQVKQQIAVIGKD